MPKHAKITDDNRRFVFGAMNAAAVSRLFNPASSQILQHSSPLSNHHDYCINEFETVTICHSILLDKKEVEEMLMHVTHIAVVSIHYARC